MCVCVSPVTTENLIETCKKVKYSFFVFFFILRVGVRRCVFVFSSSCEIYLSPTSDINNVWQYFDLLPVGGHPRERFFSVLRDKQYAFATCCYLGFHKSRSACLILLKNSRSLWSHERFFMSDNVWQCLYDKNISTSQSKKKKKKENYLEKAVEIINIIVLYKCNNGTRK